MFSVERLHFLHKLACMMAVAVVLLGLSVLSGWMLELPVLYRVSSELPAMVPMTAVSFMFTGGSLWLLLPEKTPPFRRAVGQVLAVAGILIGALIILSYFFGWADYVLRILADWLGVDSLSIEKSSPHTAIAFTLTSVGLLCLSLERPLLVNLAQWMAFISIMGLVVVFFGFAHKENMFYLFTGSIGMSLLTATGFALLGWGIILARVDKGFFRIMASDRSGGLVVRRVMSLMGLFPPLLGWLPTLVHSNVLTHTQVESMLAAFMVLVIIVIVIRLAYQLEHQENLRAQAEEVSRQHQADLAHMVRLNTMGEMASGIAHELNQPLAAITNYASASLRLLQTDASNCTRIEEPLQGILRQAVRSSEIIRRLREFVRKQQPNKTRVNIHDLIHGSLVLVRGEAAKNRTPILVEVDDKLPEVHVDAIQIEQVLLNIVQNALDALRNTESYRRQVIVRGYLNENGDVQVDVTDTGPGMEEELKKQVFDAFVTTKGGKGMGIGLSLCRSIVESHGGRLWVESEPGQGATFSFTLSTVEARPKARNQLKA